MENGQEAVSDLLSSSDDFPQDEDCENPVSVWDEATNTWVNHPYAGKRPLFASGAEDEDEEILDAASKYYTRFNAALMCHEVYEQPDLAEYFRHFEISEFTQISLCRTYANYLAQMMRAKTSVPDAIGSTGTAAKQLKRTKTEKEVTLRSKKLF